MPELEPILLLPAQPDEYDRKPGGGSTPPPIVEVNPALRRGLVEQLIEAVRDVADLPQATEGLPLAMELREQALAKSRRPYAFLASAELTPVAAEHPGELISRATPSSTRLLAAAISNSQSRADLYAISTFQSFRVWDPILDALHLPEGVSVDDLLDEARDTGRRLRIELFPWLTPLSLYGGGRQTLEEYLAEVGLPIRYATGSESRRSLYLTVEDEATEETVRGLIGVRTAALAPNYGTPGPIEAQFFRLVDRHLPVAIATPDQDVDVAVGVLDSGVSGAVVEPWVQRRWTYDVPPDADARHGTFVAGLIIAARELNGDNDSFPSDRALIFDAQVLPGASSIPEDLLLERITEVLNASGPNGPRVWNCSFNNRDGMDPIAYSPMSQELDRLARRHGILFVHSAGNCPSRTTWPPDGSAGADDALAAPAESIDGLTVGALSHLGGLTPVGAVASYSRRGPSFGGQLKPDVTHWTGDVGPTGALTGFGALSVGPADEMLESVGTSFAAPLVSGIAANVWRALEVGQGRDVDPALVKGLIVHSATVANMAIDEEHRAYYGAGVPKADSLALLDAPDSFTTIHEVELRTSVNWEKRPFPMPACLFSGHKLRAVASVTVSFAPVIDPAFGDECVRTSVDVSFGRYTLNKKGELRFGGDMGGGRDWEKHLVERGKWSPLKSYRKVWPNGLESNLDGWALQLRLTARDQSIEPLTQKVFVIVTLQGLDDALNVYQDGLTAVQRLHYPSALAVDVGRLRLQP